MALLTVKEALLTDGLELEHDAALSLSHPDPEEVEAIETERTALLLAEEISELRHCRFGKEPVISPSGPGL